MTTPPRLTQAEFLAFLDSLPVNPSSLFWADGDVERVKKILWSDPNLDVNWRDKSGHTALTAACGDGHASVVSILLAHPAIDVNLKTAQG